MITTSCIITLKLEMTMNEKFDMVSPDTTDGGPCHRK